MNKAQQVKQLQESYDRHTQAFEIWQASGFRHELKPRNDSVPDELANAQCDAKTRAGTPCKRKDIYCNGRCKFHGGMSTGARTPEGKSRQLEGYKLWLEKQRSNTKN